MSNNYAVPVRAWLTEPMPKVVAQVVERLSRVDDVQRIAVMPDVHLSHQVCVGVALATKSLIYPDAVGKDIGCGMASIAFESEVGVLRDARRAAEMFKLLRKAVPIHRHANRELAIERASELDPAQLTAEPLAKIAQRDGAVQLGTLGRGNHFLEFQEDDEGRLWLMVHSGSRAMGQAISDWHLKQASQSSFGLAYLDGTIDTGQQYLRDMEWARRYARLSRAIMIQNASEVVRKALGAHPIAASYFDADHNHVRLETHLGQVFWVHRKGAASARANEIGIIPGSMGTESYHVEGRGAEDALCSSSHGAGRAMSRHEARQSITLGQLRNQTQAVWIDPRAAPALREEAPAAYKDIRAVMRAQRELTRIVRVLRPVLSYKGT